MNKRKRFKGLIRNQTCDNCDLYANKDEKEYCTSSMLGRDLPEERTCSRWMGRIKMVINIKSVPVNVKQKKLKIRWTKETEMDILIPPDLEKELMQQAINELKK